MNRASIDDGCYPGIPIGEEAEAAMDWFKQIKEDETDPVGFCLSCEALFSVGAATREGVARFLAGVCFPALDADPAEGTAFWEAEWGTADRVAIYAEELLVLLGLPLREVEERALDVHDWRLFDNGHPILGCDFHLGTSFLEKRGDEYIALVFMGTHPDDVLSHWVDHAG